MKYIEFQCAIDNVKLFILKYSSKVENHLEKIESSTTLTKSEFSTVALYVTLFCVK
jgi:hypothetical protein